MFATCHESPCAAEVGDAFFCYVYDEAGEYCTLRVTSPLGLPFRRPTQGGSKSIRRKSALIASGRVTAARARSYTWHAGTGRLGYGSRGLD